MGNVINTFSDVLSYNQVEDLKRPVAFMVLKRGALTDGLKLSQISVVSFHNSVYVSSLSLRISSYRCFTPKSIQDVCQSRTLFSGLRFP